VDLKVVLETTCNGLLWASKTRKSTHRRLRNGGPNMGPKNHVFGHFSAKNFFFGIKIGNLLESIKTHFVDKNEPNRSLKRHFLAEKVKKWSKTVHFWACKKSVLGNVLRHSRDIWQKCWPYEWVTRKKISPRSDNRSVRNRRFRIANLTISGFSQTPLLSQ